MGNKVLKVKSAAMSMDILLSYSKPYFLLCHIIELLYWCLDIS